MTIRDEEGLIPSLYFSSFVLLLVLERLLNHHLDLSSRQRTNKLNKETNRIGVLCCFIISRW